MGVATTHRRCRIQDYSYAPEFLCSHLKQLGNYQRMIRQPRCNRWCHFRSAFLAARLVRSAEVVQREVECQRRTMVTPFLTVVVRRKGRLISIFSRYTV